MSFTTETPVIHALRDCLQQALAPVELDIADESAAHAGHAGAASGGHYAVRIVSTRFAGLAALARHRLVYDAAATLLQTRIHALRIDARTPDSASLSPDLR
jgi:BolA protein